MLVVRFDSSFATLRRNSLKRGAIKMEEHELDR
jgi:hypothetical protein